MHRDRDHDQLEPPNGMHTTPHKSGSNLNIQNNHLAPPSTTHTPLQTSHSAHGISLQGIAPRSPAVERTHRRTHSTTDRTQASSLEALRQQRPALTASSPTIPPPSASPVTPFLIPPTSAAQHLHRRRGTDENPFASPFASPAVSPSITPAPFHMEMNGGSGMSGGSGGMERGGEVDGETDAHVKAVTDPSKAVPDHHSVSHILSHIFYI